MISSDELLPPPYVVMVHQVNTKEGSTKEGSTKEGPTKEGPTQLSLLDLPAEARLQIYNCFTPVPPRDFDELDEAADTARQLLVEARKNLTLVCRQITEEWTPMFYRSTTFVVNHLKPRHISVNLKECRATPQAFADMFLKNLDTYKLRNIVRLAYDTSPFTLSSPAITSLGEILDRYKDSMIEGNVRGALLVVHGS
ncbi:hypothetical protein A1O3_00708 [Capronia epimyces CBS 606.96]|uniref:Uncharacterized protein n=1 Tax=Capronia epimyces CBS 606.96 TaxID=1182542 RepID=W9YHX1_9EURO|nr:uncharacterized protein A1O3_00708 [Capronia epimyces CBS 606.96]EXJ92158.1 hypothetical protein A1O3_00708 [Capronia epimyces CBS 606.96]